MESTVSPAPDTIPTIDTDLPCSICSYNLKGLSPTANCPECGQPVTRTYQFDLAKADPAWLRRQATTMPMLVSLCMLDVTPNLQIWAAWVSYSVALLLACVNVWACYRLGRPDPADPTDRYGSVRRAVLLASIAMWVTIAFQIPPSDPRAAYSFSKLKVYVQWPLLGVNAFLALFLVAHLCRRAGNPRLLKHARVALWTFSLAQPIVLVFYFDLTSIPDLVAGAAIVYRYFSQAAFYLTLLLLGRMYEVLRTAAARHPIAS